MADAEDTVFIKSLHRGLSILEIIGMSPHPLTITEISQKSELNKATAYRFVCALCSLGYAIREPGKRYSLGAKTLSFGFHFLNRSNLIMVVKPYLEDLSSKIGKSANLAILDGDHVVFLYRKEVKRILKYEVHPGLRIPAHCCALGKVLLSGLTDEKLNGIIKRMELVPITPKTITSKRALFKEIAVTRKRGLGIADQELAMDVASFAVPLFDHQETTIAAISISLDMRDKNDTTTRQVLPVLFETGKNISDNLGYKGQYPKMNL